MGPTTELRSGSRLLGYRIERVLGRGGMGVVYLAYQLVLDRMVALKLLAPELAQDDRFRERFLRESKLAASLDHPNIVPVFDAGDVEGRLYIAMRYVEGSDLRRILDDDAPLDPARALGLLAPIADALDAAHGRGLVHRDVKPSNILVDEAGRPYLADFGLTKTVSEQGDIEQSHFAASLDYVAPEQIEQEAVGGGADRYALGCVLYECLTGAPPFRADSRMSVLWGHLNEPPPSAAARNATLPEAIDPVIARALAKDAGERSGTARELVADAERALGLTGSSRAMTRRTKLAAAGAALAVLGGAAAVLALALTRGSEAPPPVLAPNSVAKLDATTGELAAVVPIGRDPGPLSGGPGWIWAVNTSDGTVSQIDRETGTVERTVRIDGTVSADSPSVIAAEGAIAWIVSGTGGKGLLTKVGASSGAFPPQIPLGVSDPVAVAVGEGAVWVAAKNIGSNVILKIDPKAGRVVARTTVAPGETLTDMGVGAGALWFTDWGNEETLTRLDPATLRVTGHVDTPGDDALAVGEGSVWLGDMETGLVTRVDPKTMRIVKSAAIVHRGIFTRVDVAVGGGAVWFGNLEARQVYRLDPQSLAVTARIDIAPPDPTRETYGAGPVGIVAGADGAWVAVGH